MKRTMKWIAMALCLVMALSTFVACGDSKTKDPAAGGSEVDADRLAKIKAEPEEISFLAAGFDGTDENSHYTKAIKRFEKTFGKKVKIVQTSGKQLWNEKVAAQIAAKDPISVFVISVDQYLSMYQKGFLTAVDDYCDLTKPGNSIPVMDDFVKFDGKYYAAGVTATPYVLYYNRDILAANGFDADEPKKLYESGQWTWDKFVEIARACTDEETGIKGMENMFDEVFQASNCNAAVKVNKDHRFELNIQTPEMRHTLEMVQDIFNKNKVCGNGYVTGQNKFLKGKAAMHGAYAYEEDDFNQLKKDGTISIDFGITAFPAGPDNKEKKNFGHSTGFAISNGCKAPYSAGMLIDIILEESEKVSKKTNQLVSEENMKLYEKLSENLFIPSYTDGILERGFGAFYLLYGARQGEDINKILASYETTYQKMVNDANALLD